MKKRIVEKLSSALNLNVLALSLLVLPAVPQASAQVTFDPANFTFEAEDWNFGGGMFIDNPVLCEDVFYTFPPPSTDCYWNQMGVANIDELEINLEVTTSIPSANEVYRFGDPNDLARDVFVDTYITDDSLVRTQYTAAGVQDYEVRNIVPGEWLNYTRTFPAGNYNIYLRASSAGAMAVDLHKVANATTTNQSLTYLGRFATSGATTDYELVPLTDFSGTNEVVVNFPGTAQTLRSTARTGGFTPNFYMFVASTNDANLPPLVQVTSPTAGASLEEGVVVSLQATATDAESSVTNVQFFAGTQEPLALIGETTAGPSYTFDWTPPSLGSIRNYTIRVVAADSSGLLGSGEITVEVKDPAIQVVTTADGNGADAEMRETSDSGVTSGGNYGSIRARTGSGNNEIVALRFDLTGQNLAALTEVQLNLVCMREDTSNRQLALYGVAAGATGATGTYTTDNWDENSLTQFGDMPGLLATDGDFDTQSLDTNAVTHLALIGGAVTKGEIKTFSSTELTDFVRSISGSSQVTFLIAFAPGYTSSGQARYASKEAESLDGGTPLGEAGDFAPFLQFKVLTNALPFVTITSPTQGAELESGVEVDITVDATDSDGSVTNVAFYAGTSEPLVLLGNDTTVPFSLPWAPVATAPVTPYTLRVVATDNTGQTSEDSLDLTVLQAAVEVVSTAVGGGADVEMREQSPTSPRQSNSDLNTRWNIDSDTPNRNEVVGLKFDLTGYDKSELNAVVLNLIHFRTDASARMIDVYGVMQGTTSGTGDFTTETWTDSGLTEWGDLPGLLVHDEDFTTADLDTANLVLLVDDHTTAAPVEGAVETVSSSELTSFVQNYAGSDFITLLITQGGTGSGGQFRFASREASALASSVSGTAGDFAPYLSFTVGQVAPPILEYSLGGGGTMIEFSWTGNFNLQSQTNHLGTGITTNWSDYPGGESSPITVPVNMGNGTVFFRLAE